MRSKLVILIAVALAAWLTSAASAAGDASRDGAVRQINTALRGLRDVTCTMIEQGGARARDHEGPRTTAVFVKPPDRARLETVDEHGNTRLTIKNGNTDWRVMVPRNVTKTVWSDGGVPAASPVPVLGPDRFRFLHSGVMSAKGRALRRLKYQGVERIDGVRCHRFETHQATLRTWIAVGDGLIRRQEQLSEGTWRVTRFTDLEINPGLDDALFEYEPQEGARVSVSEHIDGETRRHEYRVPYTPVPPEQQEAARGKLAQVRRRFAGTRRFTASVFESHVAHAAYTVAADGTRHPVGHERTGFLAVEPPARVRFEGERRDLDERIHRTILLISDGTNVWMANRDANAPEGRPTVVMKDRLLPAGTGKDRDRAEAVLRGEAPAGTDITFELPEYLLSPLGGIETERIAFRGEEVHEGENAYVFTVKATEQDVASTHWIGAADGVPRRIELWNRFGNVVETTVRMTDVQIDPEMSPRTFTFVNDDGRATVIDMQRWRVDAEVPGGSG